jgi:hypothetical protein
MMKKEKKLEVNNVLFAPYYFLVPNQPTMQKKK